MQRVIADPVDTGFIFQSRVYVTHVHFEPDELVVTLTSRGDKKVATARFKEVIGFRLLDEGNLLEFWPVCSQDNGWLFRIKENGWFDLETSRSGFLLDKRVDVSEYFISSQNDCVSILAGEPPKIEIIPI